MNLWLSAMVVGFLVSAPCAADFNKKSPFLTTVLGHQQLARTGIGQDDIESLVAEEYDRMQVDNAVRTHVVCAALRAATEVSDLLNDVVSEDNYEAVYSSHRKNLACWVVRADTIQADSLRDDDFIQAVVAIPPALKIHASVFEIFDGSRQRSPGAGSTKSRGFEPGDAILAVEFGLGARKGMGGIDMLTAVESWQQPRQRSIAKFDAWDEILHGTRGSEVTTAACDYSSLGVTALKFTVHIRGVSNYTSSDLGTKCLHHLIEGAALDPQVVRVLRSSE